MYSPFFDSFFSPPTIVVVSEERLKAAELKAKEKQLLQVKVQLEQLQVVYLIYMALLQVQLHH